MQGSFIVVLVTAVVVAMFAVLNAEPVTINLLFAKFELSQAVVILVTAVLGALSMFIMNFIQSLKLKRQIKQLSKKLIDAEAKNDELANQVTVLTQQTTIDKNVNENTQSNVIDTTSETALEDASIGNMYENQ